MNLLDNHFLRVYDRVGGVYNSMVLKPIIGIEGCLPIIIPEFL